MATPFPTSCNCKDLFELSRVFAEPTTSQIQRTAMQIVLMNNIAAGLVGGTKLTTTQMLEAGVCCECGIGDDNRDAMWTYILQQMSAQVGYTYTAQQLVNEACSLQCDPRFLNAILLAMSCRFMQSVNAVK